MMLILDDDLRTMSADSSWSARHRSVLDHRLDRRADLDASECLRDHTPSARTLERLGFATAITRPNYAAQRQLATASARSDAVNPDWRPL
ncbi:MAG TPA: hypothetical protein PLX09_12345 [Xanthomonadaceae bacterium]|nr:hypothetical protein [Xanthomonadaceae bacterium]